MKLSETHYLVAAVVPGGATYRLETAQFSKDEEAEAKQELRYHLSKNRPARIFVAVSDEPKLKPLQRKPLDAPWF